MLNSLALFLSVRVDFDSSVMFTCVNKVDAIGAVILPSNGFCPARGSNFLCLTDFPKAKLPFRMAVVTLLST